jgi:hypothetical protein
MRATLLAAATGTLTLLVLFRAMVLSGFDLLPGHGDSRFNLTILEHWFMVVRGLEDWRSPGIFFPVENVLGFSDGLVLLALPYLGARSAGLVPFHALQVTLLVTTALGFAGMVLFLRRGLGLALPVALAAAAAFAAGTATYQGLAFGLVQLTAVAAVPWFAWGALVWLRGLAEPRAGATAAGAGAAVLFAALLLTAFYVGWFLGIQLLIVAAIGLGWAGLGHGAPWTGFRRWLGRHWRHLAVPAAAGLAALIPFLVLYLPVLKAGAGRPFAEVAHYLPTLADLHHPQGNALWASVSEALMPWLASRKDEVGKGLTWGLLAAFTATLLWLPLRRQGTPSERPGAADPGRVALVLGLSVLLVWGLMLKLDGESLWYWVWRYVPGGVGIRSVHRFNVVLAFSVVVVAAVGLDGLWRFSRGSATARRLALLPLALIAFEQINILPQQLSRRTDFAALDALSPAPAGCRVIAALPADPDPSWHRWSRQGEISLAAQQVGLPTINGYDGNVPPGWRLFDPADRAGYHQAVIEWVDRHQLWQGLCGLDIDRNQWSFPTRETLSGTP